MKLGVRELLQDVRGELRWLIQHAVHLGKTLAQLVCQAEQQGGDGPVEENMGGGVLPPRHPLGQQLLALHPSLSLHSLGESFTLFDLRRETKEKK